MKKLFLTLLALASFSVFAESIEVRLIQEPEEYAGSFLLKNKKLQIYLRNNHAAFDLIAKDNQVSLELKNENNSIHLATLVPAKDGSNNKVSAEALSINVLTNKEKKEFKLTLCTHMGCFPYPHRETVLIQRLLEIQTPDGQTLCYNDNVLKNQPLWFLGNCNP